MKKKVMNIRPQEVTVGGERSVQYKGSDGKMHDIAAGNGETDGTSSAESVMVVNIKRVNGEIAYRSATISTRERSSSSCSTPGKFAKHEFAAFSRSTDWKFSCNINI